MENGRFEILSDGLKYIYNEAPKFEGDTSIAIPYYKGNLLKAPDTLKVTDDHDGTISPTEVTINDDNVDYDKLGIQDITYVVEDSWGRRAEKEGKIEIKSAMDSNSINIYPKENSTTSGSTSESIQQPNQEIKKVLYTEKHLKLEQLKLKLVKMEILAEILIKLQKQQIQQKGELRLHQEVQMAV